MAEPKLHHCPLCGKQFTPTEMKCTSGCLFSKHCHLTCCPHCGYSYKDQSAIVDVFKKLLRKKD